jgi:hypothetical protein
MFGAWLGLAWAGCSSDAEVTLPQASRALAVEDGLLFLDDFKPVAYLLDVERERPTVRRLELPEGERTGFARPGAERDEALVLTSGVDGGRERGELTAEVRAHLVAIDATGERARYELPSRFSRLTLSDDGRYAVVHAPEAGFSIGTGIAVVDLDAPFSKGTNPRSLNVTSLDGQAPPRFIFSDEVDAAGEKRRFLLSLATNYINILDLGHLDRGEVTIPLTLPGESRSLVPNTVAFDGDQIYVQSLGATDILVVQLTATPLDVNSHGFETSLLALPTGHDLLGMLIVGQGDEKRVIALGNGVISVIDPRTSAAQTLSVSGRYDSGTLFDARAPNDDEIRARALLYGVADNRVAFVDVRGLGQGGASAIEEVAVSDYVRRVDPLIERGYAVLGHDSSQVSLLDLERRTATPLSLGASVARTYLDVERARLWLSTDDGRLGTVDLGALVPEEILLDAPARSFVPMRGQRARIAVVHGAESGFVTLLDAEAPSRSTADALIGFFWDAFLD